MLNADFDRRMRDALIHSDEPLIAALLGLLVEMQGVRPQFSISSESIAAFAAESSESVIFIEATSELATSAQLAQITTRSAPAIVVFSHATQTRTLAAVAADYSLAWMIVPPSATELAAILRRDARRDPADSRPQRLTEVSSAEDGTTIVCDKRGQRWLVRDHRGVRTFVSEHGHVRRIAIPASETSDHTLSTLSAQFNATV